VGCWVEHWAGGLSSVAGEDVVSEDVVSEERGLAEESDSLSSSGSSATAFTVVSLSMITVGLLAMRRDLVTGWVCKRVSSMYIVAINNLPIPRLGCPAPDGHVSHCWISVPIFWSQEVEYRAPSEYVGVDEKREAWER